MLNYLSKAYLRDGGGRALSIGPISAEGFRSGDAVTLESDAVASKIVAALDRYIGLQRESMKDVNKERVDLAHVCVTTSVISMDWSFLRPGLAGPGIWPRR